MPEFQVTGGTVTLRLPDKTAPPSDANVRAIEEELGSVRAYHPKSIETFTFYEVLDQWLGPWGQEGYPIGYGKYYNVKFSCSRPLMQNPSTRQWVEHTTVCLQNALIALCVRRLRQSTLATMTEPELRDAAFDSHVSCYIGSGLSLVLVTDPYMIPLIAYIPIGEFVPFSGNAAASWSQAIQAIVGTPAVSIGYGVAVLLPAHSGVLRRAARMDARRRHELLMYSQRLGRLKKQIEQGRLDHLPWLDQVVRELNRLELRNPNDLRFARELLRTAVHRRTQLLERYRREARQAPAEVRQSLQDMLQRSRGSNR